MSCHCARGELDLPRGIELSHAAYTSRTGKPPPAIVAARFVEPFTNTPIKIYDPAELAGSHGPVIPPALARRGGAR
jgi:hypothetical protein